MFYWWACHTCHSPGKPEVHQGSHQNRPSPNSKNDASKGSSWEARTSLSWTNCQGKKIEAGVKSKACYGGGVLETDSQDLQAPFVPSGNAFLPVSQRNNSHLEWRKGLNLYVKSEMDLVTWLQDPHRMVVLILASNSETVPVCVVFCQRVTLLIQLILKTTP